MRLSRPCHRWLARFPKENHAAVSHRNHNSARNTRRPARGECPATYQGDGDVRVNRKKRPRQIASIRRFIVNRASKFTGTLVSFPRPRHWGCGLRQPLLQPTSRKPVSCSCCASLPPDNSPAARKYRHRQPGDYIFSEQPLRPCRKTITHPIHYSTKQLRGRENYKFEHLDKTKDLSAFSPAKPNCLIHGATYRGPISVCPKGTLPRIPRISRTISVGPEHLTTHTTHITHHFRRPGAPYHAYHAYHAPFPSARSTLPRIPRISRTISVGPEHLTTHTTHITHHFRRPP